MATIMPREGIYFRKGHFDDRLIDELITVRVSVAIVTPMGVEEKELTFSGSDILSAIQAMLTVVTGLGGVLGLETAQVFGGTLPTLAQQQAQARASSALAEPA
jgi:hypothetical protein